MNENLVAKLNREHKNWMMLFADAQDRGMDELAGIYGWSGIFCGRRMLYALERTHDAERRKAEEGK